MKLLQSRELVHFTHVKHHLQAVMTRMKVSDGYQVPVAGLKH